MQMKLYKRMIAIDGTEESIKLRKQLSAISSENISTIHGFCERLLREYGAHIGIAGNFYIKTFRSETEKIVTDCVNEFVGDESIRGIRQHSIVRLVIELLNKNANKGIVLGESGLASMRFETENNEFWNSFKSTFVRIFAKAETAVIAAKRDKNVLTANDLIAKAVLLLDNEYVIKQVAKQFEYVFIDEFQDTNFEQFVLLKKLSEVGVKLFMIGDEKQSIYSFRGADVENIERMEKLLPKSERENALEVNYRTDPALLDIINNLFSKPFRFCEKDIPFPHQDLTSGLTENMCENPFRVTYEESPVSIVRNITRNVYIGDRLAEYGDIAILCRRNFDLEEVNRQLKANGIPTEVMGGKGFFATTEIIDTYKLFHAVIYPSTSTILESKNTFYYRSLVGSGDTTDFDELLGQLEGVLKSFPVQDVLGIVYEKTHVFDYLRFKKQYQAVANLLKLKDKANELVGKDAMRPLQFLDYLEIMITSGKDEDEAEVLQEDRKNGVVSVYTIHKAKGLEFPVVVIPNCDLEIMRGATMSKIILREKRGKYELAFRDDVLGKDIQHIDADYKRLLSEDNMKTLAEEGRVFYVACTRAKNMLILANRKSKNEVVGGGTFSASWGKWVSDSLRAEHDNM